MISVAFLRALSSEIFFAFDSSSIAFSMAFDESNLLKRSWRAGNFGPTAAKR